MSVVRIGGDLLLHSPVRLDAELRSELEALGRVRWLAGPSRVHHLFLAEHVAAWPEAELWGAPGLAERRRDLSFHATLSDSVPKAWQGHLRLHLFQGAPRMSEVVFLHVPSRTLILTDLAFNVAREGRNQARIFHRVVGATGRFGPHRIVRAAIRDRRAARQSAETLLGWDFDRIVVSHGEILEHGGHEAFASAFGFLGAGEGKA